MTFALDTHSIGPLQAHVAKNDSGLARNRQVAHLVLRTSRYPGCGWLTDDPEVIPQKCGSVRIGHNPTNMYARRINMLRSPLFRAFRCAPAAGGHRPFCLEVGDESCIQRGDASDQQPHRCLDGSSGRDLDSAGAESRLGALLVAASCKAINIGRSTAQSCSLLECLRSFGATPVKRIEIRRPHGRQNELQGSGAHPKRAIDS